LGKYTSAKNDRSSDRILRDPRSRWGVSRGTWTRARNTAAGDPAFAPIAPGVAHGSRKATGGNVPSVRIIDLLFFPYLLLEWLGSPYIGLCADTPGPAGCVESLVKR